MSRLKSSLTFMINPNLLSLFLHPSLFLFLFIFLSFTYAQSSPSGPPTTDISWRAGHSACLISTWMVIFGGVTSPSVDIFTNPAATNGVQVFDMVFLRWY